MYARLAPLLDAENTNEDNGLAPLYECSIPNGFRKNDSQGPADVHNRDFRPQMRILSRHSETVPDPEPWDGSISTELYNDVCHNWWHYVHISRNSRPGGALVTTMTMELRS